VIDRRTVMLAGALAAGKAVAAMPIPPGRGLGFRLIRHGSEIGRHSLTFESRADFCTVRTEVSALVTLLSIPVVRYTHRVVETWRGEMLTSLTGETDKNGQHEWIEARRSNAGLVVLGSKTHRYLAPEPAGCTSYWDKRQLLGPMISLEDGVLLRPKVAALGTETISLASGETTPAEHYNLSGAFNVDLWYDASQTWTGLALAAADGSAVHYERL
jgi:hypothetical protein